MKRTAEMIEESKEQKAASVRTPKRTPAQIAASKRNLVAPWPKGFCPNPAGRPKNDVARQIAQAVISENKEAIYAAMSAALLKGNAYVFKEVADRAYGKVSDKVELTGKDGAPLEYRDMTPQDIDERIKQLERELGYANEIDLAGRIGKAQARATAKSVAVKVK